MRATAQPFWDKSLRNFAANLSSRPSWYVKGQCRLPTLIFSHGCMQRTQDVAEYQLGAFLLEMAHLINSSQTFNGTHAIAGVNLMQKQLQAEVRLSLAPFLRSGLYTVATDQTSHGYCVCQTQDIMISSAGSRTFTLLICIFHIHCWL